MSSQNSKEKEQENTGFFSGFFKMLSSFAIKLNPFAEKQIKEMSRPDRPDWRKLTNDIWVRSLEQLPLDVDLPRLAARVSVEDHRTCDADLLLPVDPNEKEGDPAMQKPERAVNIDLRAARPVGPGAANSAAMNAATVAASTKSYRAVCELLYEIMFVLGGGREKADAAKKKFKETFPEDSDLTVQKTAFKAYLVEVFGEDTPAGRCLKSVNQAIIAPGNKEALVNLLPGCFFKDSQQRPWEVVIRVFDDRVEVSHQRGQCNLDSRPEAAFSFLLETAFEFDKDLTTMTDAHLYVDEYSFGPKTAEASKSQYSKLFDAHLRPVVAAGSVAPARVISNVGRRVSNYAASLPPPEPEKEATKTEETKEEAPETKEEAVSASETKEEAAPASETKEEEAPSATTETTETGEEKTPEALPAEEKTEAPSQ